MQQTIRMMPYIVVEAELHEHAAPGNCQKEMSIEQTAGSASLSLLLFLLSITEAWLLNHLAILV